MLHVRSGVTKAVLALAADARARLAAADPGLLRLQLAVRGTSSVVLSTVAAIVAGYWGGFSPVECAGGITLSLMVPFLSREPTRRQRMRTLLILAVPAIGASVLTTVLHGQGPVGDSMFLLLVFAGFLLGPRSPQGIAIGLVAVITTYIGLFLDLPAATLPVQVASQVLAIPLIAFACFVLVPIDQVWTLRHAASAVQVRASRVLQRAAAQDSPGLRRELLRLTEAALAADDQLALLEPGVASTVRARLVDVELCAARLAAALQARQVTGREAMRFQLHARRIGRGGAYATRPGQFVQGSVREALVALGTAVHALMAASRLPARAALNRPEAPPPGPLAWRVATRVTLAAGLAMAGGMALSPQRWFWAVITVYVMFVNARTRGDTIHKGAQRVAGTLLGIVTGFLLSILASGDGLVEVAVLILSVWGMYYFFLASYTVGIFFVTVMLGLVYGLLGAPLEQVLVLRMEETAIGAVAAIVVAATVLPSRTRDQVRRSGLAVAARLAAVLRASAHPAGQPEHAATSPAAPAVSAMDAMRLVDRGIADLKLALAPLVAGRTLLRRASSDRRASALLDCVHWARMLAAGDAAGHPGADPALAARLDGMADRLDAMSRGEVPAASIPRAAASPASVVDELDGAVSVLAERLETGAYEAFALDR